jgi:transketolase
MRKQFIETVSKLMDNDEKIITLLGDIGVFGFKNIFNKYPKRIYNSGILEQTMIGIASGLSINGNIPIVHTIAPFIVERAYEQLKLDFGYQNLCGNFVSVGGSFDYSALGFTHQCPADVNIINKIPNFEIIVPGHKNEFDVLFKQSYFKNPTYYRLAEYSNSFDMDVEFGKLKVLREGKDCTIVVVGNMLESIINATIGMDCTILYCTTIKPFDYGTLLKNYNEKIVICEPYYSTLLDEIVKTIKQPTKYKYIGVDKFINKYGTYNELVNYLELDITSIKTKIIDFIW